MYPPVQFHTHGAAFIAHSTCKIT